MKVSVGQVVYSKAGRDAGRKLVVIGIINDNSVLVSDGDLRRVEKPKTKKIKHLTITEKVILPLSDKFENGIRVSNSEIRKALAEIGDAEVEFN
ncbi:KOW domain-containing RNA-binding protein [Acetivibrio mesophilus]|uniref:KOW domain-containing protein n=1 Tax=Acetivibrio mesophilus TaxID=2487273 RepID=A0A4Q0I5N7_9FIRM|nr:KOW domain-containing RNA-binding protein [Acetivibrio mesophilus]ODM26725.1 50S ribosomal protein L14 [Clostridium sp. Bc-iso-3]RXE58252.1 KOW domain-containing protein [Acetivibrio mesophilus]HHV28235.1 KOW domain-containing protein [Clostridium sp.]